MKLGSIADVRQPGRLSRGRRAGVRPNELSGRTAAARSLARALIHEPRIIVCDRPTVTLDNGTGHAVMELLAPVAVRRGRAVIVDSHGRRVVEVADITANVTTAASSASQRRGKGCPGRNASRRANGSRGSTCATLFPCSTGGVPWRT